MEPNSNNQPRNFLNFRDRRNWGTYGGMLAGGVGAMAGSYLSNMAGSAEENTRNEDLMAGRLTDVQTLFKTKYYQDFMDTASAKSAVEELRGNLLEAIKIGQSQAIGTGGTAEATVANKSSAQSTFANAISQLTGYGSQYKENALNNLQRLIAMATQDQSNVIRDKARNYALQASNIAGVGENIIGGGLSLAGGGI